ncbi:MAG: DUF3857 domain-containing protein [Salinivirgaceae bacterium]|jgi:hypothetical protein|nr:DUF3857 domain-containing protein [Salinivirgaceae bacterium]
MKLLNIFIILFVVSSLNAQERDATFMRIEKTYTLNSDGSYTFDYKHQLKYESYLAFHRKYGETFIVYNPDYQSVEVTKCQTTMADGKVVKAPDNAFNEVLPRFAASSGTYNNLRELVITHTGLEVGSIVDLQYTVNSDKFPLDIFAGMESLLQTSPTTELVLKFNIPSDKYLTFGGHIEEQVVNENEDSKTYTFIYKNLPEALHNSMLGLDKTYALQFCDGSTFKDQIQELFENRLSSSENTYAKANAENMDEIMKMHREVVKNIKTIHIPFSFQTLPLPEIEALELKNSGTELEKAFLLHNRFIERNIQSKIVFVVPANLFDESKTPLESVGKILVMVPSENGDPLLMPLDRMPGNNMLYTQYNKVLVAVDGSKNIQIVSPKTMNYAKVNFTLDIGSDYAEAKYNGNITGIFAGWPGANLYSKRLFTQDRQEVEEEIIIDKDPATLKISGRFKTMHSQMGDYIDVVLPQLNSGFHQIESSDLPKEGKYKIDLGYPLHEEYTYTIELSDEQRFVQLPEEIQTTTEHFDIILSTQVSGNVATINVNLNFKATSIPIDEYQKFRKTLAEIQGSNQYKVVVKVK